MRTYVAIRRPARRARPQRVVRASRRQSGARRRLLIGLLAVIVVVTAAIIKSSVDPRPYVQPLSAAGRYVALPHPATADMKREAAFLARKYQLPLIAEPDATSVEIRRFK